MRENRTYGSEGGEAQLNEPSLPLSAASKFLKHLELAWPIRRLTV